jgi:hypothetical protein
MLKGEITMMLPKQAPAVSRKINRFAAVPVAIGVRPSFDWHSLLSTVGNVAKTALPIVAGLL